MADPVYGRNIKPGSLLQLSRFTRGWNDQMANFLLPLAKQDYFFKFYDFDEDTINGDWTVNNAGGAAVSSFAASTSLEYGQLTGSTGTANDATAAIAISYDGIFFDAARNPGMMARIKLDAVSNFYMEVTWSDAPTATDAASWDDEDTPTQASNGQTDVTSIVYDSAETNKSCQLITVGTTDTTVTAAAMSAATTTAGDPLTAATFSTFLLQVGDGWSYANIDGKASSEARLAVGMDTGVKLVPQILVKANSATSVVCTIDYIALWCNRE